MDLAPGIIFYVAVVTSDTAGAEPGSSIEKSAGKPIAPGLVALKRHFFQTRSLDLCVYQYAPGNMEVTKRALCLVYRVPRVLALYCVGHHNSFLCLMFLLFIPKKSSS